MTFENTHAAETDLKPDEMELLANAINAIFAKSRALHGNIKDGRIHVTTKEFQGTYSPKRLKRLIERNEITFNFIYDCDAEES